MLHMLVVDDDSLIRSGVCKMIEKYCLTECRIYEAENGWKGIEQTCAYPIDIIFADIRMPLCGGVEMLRKLRDMQYNGQIVIISGFDDYSYVRSAIKLGASDYLLKPIVSQEFQSVLNKCIREIQTRTDPCYFYSEDSMKNEWMMYLAQQNMVEVLLSSDAEATKEYFIKKNISLKSNAHLFLVDTAEIFNMNDTGKMNTFLNISEAAGALYSDSKNVFLQGEYKKLWVIIVIDADERITNVLKSYLRKNQYRFACAEDDTAEHLTFMYQKCFETINQYFYDMKNNTTPGLSEMKEQSLDEVIDAVCNYDFVQFAETITQLFYSACQKQPLLEDFKKMLCSMIYSIMSKNNHFINVISKYKFTDKDIINLITDSISARILLRQIIDMMNIYIVEVTVHLPKQENITIMKAKNYIQKNYANNISLTEVSEVFSLNPVYFSSFFKGKTGQTYSQYLRKVRIERSKELIQSTNQKFYQIAESVGYHDNSQFYRAFKDETGLSPEEFKNSKNSEFNSL